MVGKDGFLVRIFCATYNHESYITDAIQGFVMQETSFPVVYTIVDDASTDKTAEVLRRFVNEHFDVGSNSGGYDKDTDYGHVTFARHKTNKNCYFAVIYLKENHFSQKKSKAPYLTEWMDTKYVALCEGDDYWTDPYKLQKQVDYMEKHEKCVCFAHNSFLYDTALNCLSLFVKSRVNHCDFTLPEFLKKAWFTPTQSLLYRQTALSSDKLVRGYMHGDYSLLIRLLLYPDSYLHYDNQVMSVYRAGGYASTHYNETKLCDDFIALFEDAKAESNHVCDDVFDQLIEIQEKEKLYLAEYDRDLKKSRSTFVKIMHFICRKIASVSNLYFDCLRVEKRVVKKCNPPLEKLK